MPSMGLPNNYYFDAPGGNGSYSESRARSVSGEQLSREQQARISQLYPMLLAQLGQAGGMGNAPFSSTLAQVGGAPMGGGGTFNFGAPYDFGSPYNFDVGRQTGGPVNPYPDITTGPIWSDQRVQERVNLTKAQGEQSLASQQQQLAERTGALGYGANSPLYQALMANMQAQNLAGQTAAENSLRWQAAEGNAGHLLKTQQAAVERARAMGDEDVRRQSLASQDDLARRQMAAADELSRRRLGAQDQLQRMQYTADDSFRRRQLASDDDLRRRQLAVQQQGNQMQAAVANQSALLNALNSMNQPTRFSRSESYQNSGQRGQRGGLLQSALGQSRMWG